MANALESFLMPKFKNNSLIEFHHGNSCSYLAFSHYSREDNTFPKPWQMECIWSHQQKLQTFHSAHIGTMLLFMRNNPEKARKILQSVNQLTLVQEPKEKEKPELITWLLENIAISSLRKLTIIRWDETQHLRKVQNLFSNHAFINLTYVRFEDVIFDTKLDLERCPSLRELEVFRCGSLPTDVAAKLSVPTKLPLQSFHFACDDNINQLEILEPILSQIQGLSILTLEISRNYISNEKLGKYRREIVAALGIQQKTLVELVVREDTALMRPLLFGDGRLFAVIEGCHTLQRLSLPLRWRDPIPWYNCLMRRLPRLMYFWLTDSRKNVGARKEEKLANELKKGIPASSAIRFLALNSYCLTRQEISTQPGLEAKMAVSAVTNMDWKDANRLFYNRYPYPLNLPKKATI